MLCVCVRARVFFRMSGSVRAQRDSDVPLTSAAGKGEGAEGEPETEGRLKGDGGWGKEEERGVRYSGVTSLGQ